MGYLENCRDMGIQCFLNFEDICHIYFSDIEYFSKVIKGIRDTGTPLPGQHKLTDSNKRYTVA